MSAVAGPGPSTMASSTSSMVPTSARMKVKKRVVNLVNPADPQDFSAQSISPSTSPNTSAQMEEETPQEEKITPPIMRYSETTQTFNFTPGVKGILRSTGTPGSGNGVRFFPKNKFRIITPNASTHQQTPKPPASPTNSFFSQLLAVTIPSMSPRRGSTPQQEEVKAAGDESWEIPGQEGEISLIASSVASGDRSIENHNWDEQVDEREIEESIDIDDREDSWNGQPEIHCSPLALPLNNEGNTSRDPETSLIGFELPSTELQYPDDMSNLLSTKFQPGEYPSFSINDPPSTSLPPSRELQTLSPIREDMTMRTEDEFWNNPAPTPIHSTNGQSNVSMTSEKSLSELELSNPTIRRPVAAASTAPQDQNISPIPIGRPYNTSSIFADMSAEQAELTWPLTRRTEDDDLDSGFPSPIRSSSPHTSRDIQTPKAGGAGDMTQFFDTTMTMSLSSPTTSTSAIILRSSLSPGGGDLMIPTKKLFEAQVSHTSALAAELELYKTLARKLQDEVVERDECLAKLNLRALDAELLHDQVQDLQREITSLNSRKSLSPSPTPALRGGMRSDGMSDRTMAAQSEAKELEIRLAKTLADSDDMVRKLHEVQVEKERLEDNLKVVEEEKRAVEDQERDRLVKDQANIDEIELLRKELEDANSRIEEMTNQGNNDEDVQTLQEELKEAHQHIADLQSYEDEVHALKAELDSAHRQLDDYESKENNNDNDELRTELEETQRQLEKVEQELEVSQHQLQERANEVESLQNEIDNAHQQIDQLEQKQSDGSSMQRELTEAQEKIRDLKVLVKELTENKLVDEDEIENLLSQIDKLKGYRKTEEDMKRRLEGIERRLEIELGRREDMERRLKEEEEVVRELEKENDELRQSLEQTKRVDDPSATKLKDEINKLRSESSLKDLEILHLQRRKNELKEDREMLNIALDSKQQELELMKRKFAVKGIAGSTPLGTSQKTNIGIGMGTPASTIDTPLVGKGLGVQTRRRSSLTQTPLPSVPKHLPSSLQTPIPGRRTSYGVQLHPSTRITSRVMKRLEEEENQPQIPVHGSVRARRERVLA
ncbi:hypothetical protein I302_107354 [Kwoniella bestiolae CBS 10118]|uniref:Uncharacterized protein n=1 Tax=Kwoniella bestiolae CBS 10118 TaxID=1296100 RepID=A0A1B9FYS4_9TREE|nr:hypothetical protein I302_06908 [Kwoniella bestiolae CBS 10118]OCF23922.1 hypothetical protein I302_06908 [Kwoniella bestiolae CBS 10118]